MSIKADIAKLCQTLSNKAFLQRAGELVLSFSGGILAGVPCFNFTLSPFAAALPACVGQVNSVVMAAGAILGIFIFHSGMSAFRYFATVLTSTAILNICLSYLGFKKDRFMRIFCPAVCSFLVNTVFLFSQKFSSELVFSLYIETLIAALCIPVFTRGIKQIFSGGIFDFTDEGSDCVPGIITLCIFAGQLRGLGIVGEFFCHFFLWGFIIFFGVKKAFFTCCVTSAFAAFVYALGGEADFLCGAFAICGAVFTLIRIKSPLGEAVAALTLCFIGCALSEYATFFPSFAACLSAAVIISAIPRKILLKRRVPSASGVTDTIAIPLQAKEISSAVEDLGECINTVRKTLKPLSSPELSRVIFNACEKICNECEIQDSCINSIRKSTNPYYGKIAVALKENRLDFSDFPDNFNNTCYHSEQIMNTVKQAYFVYCTNVNAQNKISRFQEITGNQLRSFGSIIAPLCSCAVSAGAVTSKHSPVAVTCARELDIEVISAQVCTNKADQEYLNLHFRKNDENFNVTLLTEKLCRETGLELDFPTLVQKDDIYTLIFKQKPKVNFRISAAVKSASAQGVSGDYYRSFKDSFSRQVVILSDGMGTGTRAAVDSAFTCEALYKLLKSGLDVKTSVSAVNCATVMKSTDESLATVDLLIADPVTSTVQIYKCGAAPSFILKDGKTSVIEVESTPIGILDKTDMARSEFSVSPGDIILIVSDGITSENWGWIAAELKTYQAETPTALAKHILQCSCDRRLGKRADDMTVIAIMVE